MESFKYRICKEILGGHIYRDTSRFSGNEFTLECERCHRVSLCTYRGQIEDKRDKSDE